MSDLRENIENQYAFKMHSDAMEHLVIPVTDLPEIIAKVREHYNESVITDGVTESLKDIIDRSKAYERAKTIERVLAACQRELSKLPDDESNVALGIKVSMAAIRGVGDE